MLGYWKGEQVALIPQYHPDAKPGEYEVELVEFPSDYPVPRYIDPKETPLSVIREICTLNDIPFFWITGINPRDRDAIKITPDNPIENAIEVFIALGTTGTTTGQYRRIFEDLIEGCVIDPSTSTDRYLETANQVEAAALNFSCPEKPDKEYYNYNDKIYNMLRSFHSFLKQSDDPGPKEIEESDENSQKKENKRNKHYRPKRKGCLTNEEAKVFFPALKGINATHELIARVLWWYNHQICDHPDAPVVQLESVVLMQLYDIGEDSLKDIRERLPENIGGNSVCVRSHSRQGSKMVCYYVPGKMYAELSELASKTDRFIFRNKAGGPIDTRLVRKSFAKACKKANLRNITPSQLR